MNIAADLIELAPARPENHAIAWKLIYETDPGLFEYYFSNDLELMESCLSNWWQRSEGWFSHASCNAATYSGSLAGIEIGFTREDFQKHTRPSFYYAKETMNRAAFEHFSDVFRNYVPYLFPFIPRDAYYVQNLAVKTEMRRQGLGKALLNAAFHRAKEKGLKSCQLDVMSDSIAVDFYQKMGMEVLAITRMPYLEKNYGIPMHYRMRRMFE
jgi:ribosomal protein S18 acetylase RimI-like enzyme